MHLFCLLESCCSTKQNLSLLGSPATLLNHVVLKNLFSVPVPKEQGGKEFLCCNRSLFTLSTAVRHDYNTWSILNRDYTTNVTYNMPKTQHGCRKAAKSERMASTLSFLNFVAFCGDPEIIDWATAVLPDPLLRQWHYMK